MNFSNFPNVCFVKMFCNDLIDICKFSTCNSLCDFLQKNCSDHCAENHSNSEIIKTVLFSIIIFCIALISLLFCRGVVRVKKTSSFVFTPKIEEIPPPYIEFNNNMYDDDSSSSYYSENPMFSSRPPTPEPEPEPISSD